MKKLILILILSLGAFAQEPTSIYAIGPSFNSSASVAVAGTGLYAHKLTDGTFGFTVVDALPNSVKPFTVTTNFSFGVAQKIVTLGKVPIYIPTSAGVSWNGVNTGWAWSTGALAYIKPRADKNYVIMPTVRVAKSSVGNGTGYQPIVGILFGWGQ